MRTVTKYSLLAAVLPAATAVYGVFIKDAATIFNSALTIFCIFLILLIQKWLKIFSRTGFISALIFILLAVFAGRTLGAYGKIPYWDKFLHFSSGFILVLIGRDIYRKKSRGHYEKGMLKFFSFLFAVSGAAIWEIFEFTCDSLLKTTAQNNSLTDTMLDIITGTLSALITLFF